MCLGWEKVGAAPKVYAFGTREALTLGALYRIVPQRRNGLDSMWFIIHCFIDPGTRAARDPVRIPVFGLAEVMLRMGRV